MLSPILDNCEDTKSISRGYFSLLLVVEHVTASFIYVILDPQ